MYQTAATWMLYVLLLLVLVSLCNYPRDDPVAFRETVQNTQQKQQQSPAVTILDKNNVDDFIRNHDQVFICFHYGALPAGNIHAVWKSLAEHAYNETKLQNKIYRPSASAFPQKIVHIAAMDCWGSNQKYCTNTLRVTASPTIRWYGKGETSVADFPFRPPYRGRLTVSDLWDAMQEMQRQEELTQELQQQQQSKSLGSIQLTENLHSYLRAHRHVYVMYCIPWLPACQFYQKQWDALAAHIQTNATVHPIKIRTVDCTRNSNTCHDQGLLIWDDFLKVRPRTDGDPYRVFPTFRYYFQGMQVPDAVTKIGRSFVSRCVGSTMNCRLSADAIVPDMLAYTARLYQVVHRTWDGWVQTQNSNVHFLSASKN